VLDACARHEYLPQDRKSPEPKPSKAHAKEKEDFVIWLQKRHLKEFRLAESGARTKLNANEKWRLS
jgi:hypothetical protein